jgi:hypothetical protein
MGNFGEHFPEHVSLIASASTYPKGDLKMLRTSQATTLALALAGCLSGQVAKADVFYQVENTKTGYLFFIYDSPSFITTKTTVLPSELTFLNPAGATTTSIVFIPDSTTHPGTSELDVLNPTSTITEEFRYYPEGTFTRYGLTHGDSYSFGYPVSALNVTDYPDYTVPVPEPTGASLLATGLIALLGFSAATRGFLTKK